MSDAEKGALKLSPYLNVQDASAAIEFYCSVFAASERYRLVDPNDGRIGHAELQFGDETMMISDEYPDFGATGPLSFGGSPVKLHLSVEDVEQVFERAIENGAVEIRSVKTQFHGSRSGVLTDPFGHVWHLETKIEDVSPDDMQRRWNAASSG